MFFEWTRFYGLFTFLKNGEDFAGKDRDKDDDTLDDLIDSVALNKYESDFEGMSFFLI